MHMKFKSFLLIIVSSIVLISQNIYSQVTEVYVSDVNDFSAPWKILKYDENGENPDTFITTNLAWPQDILFLEDQNVVLISNFNSGRITKYNSSTGEYIENFATGISGPTRMKIGKDSLLYVLQWDGSNLVKRYRLDGTFLDNFTSVGVPQSIGIDWDDDGNLYISSYYEANVRKFDQNGNDLGFFITTNLLGPTNIWFDNNGDLLVSDYDGTAVKRFDPDGNYLGDFITGIHFSEGVDIFQNGNILIGNGATSSVKMFDSNGNYIKDFIPGGSGGLVTPNAVVIRVTNISSVSNDENSPNINSFILEQNYPNPFNPVTTIKYSLREDGFTKLKVYDVLGKEIATLLNEDKPAGNYEINFDAQDIPSGVYLYSIISGSYTNTKKMILLK